jgi:hypothetical protein
MPGGVRIQVDVEAAGTRVCAGARTARYSRCRQPGSPLINSAGEVEALSAILRHISKQKDAEEALIESEERLKPWPTVARRCYG